VKVKSQGDHMWSNEYFQSHLLTDLQNAQMCLTAQLHHGLVW